MYKEVRAMESKAKLLGHPIHQMLIVFPLGLLITALIFDVVRMVIGDVTFAAVAFWCIAAGIVGGLIAAVFGLIDWLNIPSGTRAKRIGMWHGIGNVVVVGLFAASWLLRRGDPALVPSTLAFALALVAVGLGSVTGWLGGELVDRLGVGVDRGAHLDAPSSLSGQPADANLRGAAHVPAAPRERKVGR
jgi:uncharacterized membrane protein